MCERVAAIWLLVQVFHFSVAQDVLFVAKLAENETCITNSSLPMFWSQETEVEKQVSHFASPANEFDCEMHSGKACLRHWTRNDTGWNLTSFKEGPIRELIKNRRWEKLHVYNFTSDNETRAIVVYHDQCKTDFSIPISIYARSELYYYWEHKFNPPWNNIFSMGPGYRWIHKKIPSEGCRNQNEDTKTNRTENIRNLIILSLLTANTTFFWKNMAYEYIYTTKQAESQLGGSIRVQNNSVCIKLFLAKCANCSFKFLFKGAQKSYVPFFSDNSSDTEWYEKTLEKNSITEDVVHLYVDTSSTNNSNQNYWAIDDVRTCGTNNTITGANTRLLVKPKNGKYCSLIFNENTSLANITTCPECSAIFPTGCMNHQPRLAVHHNQTYCSYEEVQPEVEPNVQVSNDNRYFYIALVLLIVPLVVVPSVFLHKKCSSKRPKLTGNDNVNNEISVSRLSQRASSNFSVTEEINFKPVDLSHFEQYLQECVDNSDFQKQFDILYQDEPVYAELETVRKQERIVRLDSFFSNGYFENSHAEYIDGYKTKNAFILAPKSKYLDANTLWPIIWQENIKYMVWISDATEEPTDIITAYRIDGFSVRFKNKLSVPHFDKLCYVLEKNGTRRELIQFDFNYWSDHIPFCAQNVSQLMKCLMILELKTTAPILIHSADVEKLRVLLLADSSLRKLSDTGKVDIFDTASRLKKYFTINNVSDYYLVHIIVQNVIVNIESGDINIDDLRSIEQVNCNALVKLLVHCVNRSLQNIKFNTIVKQRENSSFYENTGELGENRIIEMRLLTLDIASVNRLYNTLNTNVTRVFRSNKQFLVSRHPNSKHLSDFWALILTYKVTLIISFNQLIDVPQWRIFYPTNGNETLVPSNGIILQHRQTRKYPDYDIITLCIQLNGESNYKTVELLILKIWPETQLLPNLNKFLKFWIDSHRIVSSKRNQVLLTCRDGISCSSVYIAVSYMLERLKNEGICDILKAIQYAPPNSYSLLKEKAHVIFFFQLAQQYADLNLNQST